MLVGGVAVAAHGYVRGTEDLGVVVARDAENIDRLLRALHGLTATLPTQGGRPIGDPDRAWLEAGRGLTLQTASGDVDVVGDLPGVPSYAELAADSVETEAFGLAVRVCSLEHLREMKRTRGGHADLADLENLPK